MRFYLANTDLDWYRFLRDRHAEDVNFWHPNGHFPVSRLEAGTPFLFRLKSPWNRIAGLGFFSSNTLLPLSMSWETFGEGNGCDSFSALKNMIDLYRTKTPQMDPVIACTVLTNPVFFVESDWLQVPSDWNPNIVSGKFYDTANPVGERLWHSLQMRLEKYLQPLEPAESPFSMERSAADAYDQFVLTRIRRGQASFRTLVTDAYGRRCSITGEKTLPVLEAAHIQPYAESGPLLISNGILLRSDIHRLFDRGYLTLTPELRVEVSSRIREEFQNGREYYQFQGRYLQNIPALESQKPDRRFIDWHNEHIFRN